MNQEVGAIVMTATSDLHAHVHPPQMLARVLARTAKTGIYLVRGAPRELQRAARVRAVMEGTTLRAVLVHALRDYAAGNWTPRRDTT
jgi:hypothetical protein